MPTTPRQAVLALANGVYVHNQSMPIGHLAPEILLLILSFYMSEFRKPTNPKENKAYFHKLSTLSSVASPWRNIIQNTTSFWSTIAYGPRSADKVAISRCIYELFVQRSKHAPLDLIIRIGSFQDTIFESVCALLHRCRTLSIDAMWEMVPENHSIFSFFPILEPVPLLRVLELVIPDPDMSRMFGMPKGLVDHPLTTRAIFGEGHYPIGLTHLRVYNRGCKLPGLIKVLRSCPELVSLELSQPMVEYHRASNVANADPPIECPKLTVLSIHNDLASTHGLSYPHLRHLRYVSGFPGVLPSNPSMDIPTLTTLEIRWNPINTPALATFLASQPLLLALDVHLAPGDVGLVRQLADGGENGAVLCPRLEYLRLMHHRLEPAKRWVLLIPHLLHARQALKITWVRLERMEVDRELLKEGSAEAARLEQIVLDHRRPEVRLSEMYD